MTQPFSFPIRPIAFAAAAASIALLAPQAQAGFNLDGGTNFAVLYEGNGGNTLSFNNSNITGNIGIGATGKWADSGGCSGQCQIMGVVEFSAANTGLGFPTFTGSQFSPSAGTTYTPALGPGNPLFSQSAVTTALTTLNSLSQSLGGEAGTNLAITNAAGMNSVNANSGMPDGSGNEVFTATSVSFPNGTFTITGTSTQMVVINVPFSASFNGSIVLAGGITSDQVLINFNQGNYATLSGGSTLTISTNGAATTGTFLNPNGGFQINHSELDGRIFGGDTVNSSIVSGANIFAPLPPNVPVVPEPGTLALFGSALVIFGIVRRRWSL